MKINDTLEVKQGPGGMDLALVEHYTGKDKKTEQPKAMQRTLGYYPDIPRLVDGMLRQHVVNSVDDVEDLASLRDSLKSFKESITDSLDS